MVLTKEKETSGVYENKYTVSIRGDDTCILLKLSIIRVGD